MSIYGIMKTGVSGMNAQSNKIGTVADNIQNQNTAGYKRSSTEFSSLVLGNNTNSYQSGGVSTYVRYSISQQGPLQYTTSALDLAISGNGFFAVRDASGSDALTRAGAFVPVAVEENGVTKTRLMNTAGYQLLGQKLPATGLPGSTDEMVRVEFETSGLRASASTNGVYKANLPALTAVRLGPWPPATVPGNGQFDAQTSMVVYDQLGSPVTLDIYLAKTGNGEWTAAVWDRGDSTLAPPRAASLVGTGQLTFDPVTGKLTGGDIPLDLNVPHSTQAGTTFPFSLDMSGMTQLDGEYVPYEKIANGNPSSEREKIEISPDGVVYEIFKNGSRNPAFVIPLANVASPDRLSVESGNVYKATQASGAIQIGEALTMGFGGVVSGALEGSNVDIGAELADMIQAQSAYTANSKVFQAGSELLDVLVNLKR